MMENRNESPWPFPSLQTRPIVETPPGWITLPVLLGHDATRPIGFVRLQASQLPKSPDWCLSLAYTSPPVVRRDRPTVGAYQPEAMGLTLQPAAPAEAAQPWIAEALRLADYWHRCHVEFSTVGDLDAARAALESHLRAAPRAAVDFDTWQQSPYTQVLHESIAEDYVPRGSIDALPALQAARTFIRNGVDLGYIRMPDADCPGSAHDTLPLIEAAIAALSSQPAAEARALVGPGQVDREMVICPGCCHQFRAIPEAVQRLLLDAGIEAPFTAAGAQR